MTALLAPLAQVNVPDFGKPSGCVAHNGTFCSQWFSDNWSSALAPGAVACNPL